MIFTRRFLHDGKMEYIYKCLKRGIDARILPMRDRRPFGNPELVLHSHIGGGELAVCRTAGSAVELRMGETSFYLNPDDIGDLAAAIFECSKKREV